MRVPSSYLAWPLAAAAAAVAKLLYRVRSSGTEHLPIRGGAVLVSNHLSYADVVALQLACPRPLRFVAYRGPRSPALFDWVFRRAGVITVAEGRPGEAVRRAIHAAARGEVVCLFPEGQISRTGQLMEIKRGYEVIARRAGVPVVPAAVDGLWGSIFSFSGNRYLWKSPRLLPTPVFVAFGPALAPAAADPWAVRRALLDLGAAAFAERPRLRRHFGREVVRALARRPGRVALVDRTAERRPVTAGQLLAAAAVLGRRLRAAAPERRVGIVLPPGVGAAIANLAVICAGKIPVNLNFTAGANSLRTALKLGGISTVLSAEAMREKLPDFPWPAATLDLRAELAAAGGRRAMLPWLLAAWLLPNQGFAALLGLPRAGDGAEAALLFTSGSAGEPKGVVLTHRNLLANCDQVSSMSILPRDCSMLGCLPLFHSFGFTVTLWYPLLRGCGLVTVPSPLDARKLIDAISAEGVTTLIAAPTFLRPILKKAEPAELRSLELVVAGGESLPEDLERGFLARFHLTIYQGYGLTETAPVSNLNQPDPPVTTATAGPQPARKAGTVGRLLPGMTARILDPDTRQELPFTSTGLVCLRGANVFPGYLDEVGLGRTAAAGGWLVTGDLGNFDAEGFLTIAGRLARFSKIGGEMVPHGTVEQAITAAFSLDQTEGPLVVVVGVPDAAKGEELALIAACDLPAEALRERLHAAGLPNLWLPRSIVRVEKIPLLGSGKLDLAACRAAARPRAG
jgi:acyl-[acyl-carrier-protein]-phospholipid O-acyltransferase/long-chain-fatty-acid--[acyl-carrier-protein] ligase